MGRGLGYFTNYPKHVFLILTNEFCERFSYYGMKAILVLFMTNALNFDEDTATAIYHAFNVVCYFTPLFGAMVSDGWLGKFKTILYVSIMYGIGNIIMTFSAIPYGGEYIVWLPFVGLTLIAFGTGGIKPCVSAFGGDQFSPEQKRQKESFFSLFYMAINIGSLLSTIITPIIRSNVFCFGTSCYALAFGIPAALMVISIFIFAAGYKWYTKIPPGDSIIGNMFGCIWQGLKGKCSCSKNKEPKDHWLDYAEEEYGDKFVADMKDVMKVLWMFLPLPVFWALFDQQGSRWTLQATQMNGEFGSFVMQPDMMQVFNPLFVVIIVPLLESLIYPCLNKLKVPNRPLQRMGWGMMLAATAFLYAGLLQIGIDNSAAKLPAVSEAQIMFVNTAPCEYVIKTDGCVQSPVEETLLPGTNTKYLIEKLGDVAANRTYIFTPAESVQSLCSPMTYTLQLKEQNGYQIFILTDNDTIQIVQEKVRLTQTAKQSSAVHFFNNLSSTVDILVKSTKGQQDEVWLYNVSSYNVSQYGIFVYAEYDVTVFSQIDDGNVLNATIYKGIFAKNGAVYTALLTGEPRNITLSLLTEIGVWTVNIFLQVPQYFIITTGECLFSVTGLAFAYSQAPIEMKSIMQAAWLLTVAIGNVVVIIVAETGSAMSQMAEFFLFSGLMYVTDVVFIIMALFYVYVTPRDQHDVQDELKSRKSSQSGISNKGVEVDDVKKEPLDGETIKDENVTVDTTTAAAYDVIVTKESDKESVSRSNSETDGDDSDESTTL